MDFFHFTLQGLGIWSSIVVVGGAVIRLLKKGIAQVMELNQNVSIWRWQHLVMWKHHVKHYDVPEYPKFFAEQLAQELEPPIK